MTFDNPHNVTKIICSPILKKNLSMMGTDSATILYAKISIINNILISLVIILQFIRQERKSIKRLLRNLLFFPRSPL